jgi:1-acyl-sn-glycerol-3-phosphate acyltransferase
MITYVRSLLFKIYFYLWTAFSCVTMIPFLFTKPVTAAKAGHFWATGIILGLKYICGITYELRGLENLPLQGGFIVASKHQSAWDTIIFLMILKAPCYILKRELLKLPLFGQYLCAIGMIAIDRSAGMSALKSMVEQTKNRTDEGRPVIIFPEGTRTKPGQVVQYQPGIAMLYNNNTITAPIIPTALNSGVFWHKDQFKHPRGTIILEYLAPIEKGLDRKAFLSELEQRIENASNKLISEAKNKHLNTLL